MLHACLLGLTESISKTETLPCPPYSLLSICVSRVWGWGLEEHGTGCLAVVFPLYPSLLGFWAVFYFGKSLPGLPGTRASLNFTP